MSEVSNDIRTIKFRPLRVIKKTGKIMVASYMQWRIIKTADYNSFILMVDENYKMLNDSDFVYNHLGKQLFFYGYNPGRVPIIKRVILDFEDIEENPTPEFKTGNNFILQNSGLQGGEWFTFRMDGCDCDGVPTLNFYTADYIATHSSYINLFEPLTVKMVKQWFGWFLWQLENSKLTSI